MSRISVAMVPWSGLAVDAPRDLPSRSYAGLDAPCLLSLDPYDGFRPASALAVWEHLWFAYPIRLDL
jgi:hypothetical protein